MKMPRIQGKEDISFVHAGLEQLQAVETLEYHNKNWLNGNNKTRCEDKLRLYKEILEAMPDDTK